MEIERKNYKVLIADDEPTMVDLLDTVLIDAGFQTSKALDGGQALMLAKANQFDVVLTDINMPVLSGTELLRLLKQENPQSQVVIMTGQATVDSAILATRYGAFDYLQKPFDDISQIPAVIERAIKKREETSGKERALTELIEKAKDLIKNLRGVTYLVVDDGFTQRRVVLEKDNVLIGSGEKSVVPLTNQDIREEHVIVHQTERGWELVPMGPVIHGETPVTTPLVLNDETQVQLGSVGLTFFRKQSEMDLDQAIKSIEEGFQPESKATPFTLSGKLEDTGFFDLLQLVALMKKEGTLSLQSADGKGQVYFGQDGVLHVKYDEVINEKALFRMGLLTHGTFDFHPSLPNPDELTPPLEEATSMMLLEVCRQADEFKNLEQPAPPRSLRLGVIKTWLTTNPTRNARQNLVLKHVVQDKYVGLILDNLPVSDLEAAKTLIDLRLQGALAVLS